MYRNAYCPVRFLDFARNDGRGTRGIATPVCVLARNDEGAGGDLRDSRTPVANDTSSDLACARPPSPQGEGMECALTEGGGGAVVGNALF